ncbi:neutral/alkaline non-lysosomal ceramidase N-terminal domain-containing protein [Brassicibacter mesophilus]|uniref:neutral/alkaline non-lysosomal ceramidase N-terminal domain-containing protein n=1 Tax=Brassicibacter mesophilus TaxID=745119 RepID=UPI003D1F8391
MKIGWAKQDITPQLPISMGGYGDRKALGNGVLDNIYARTLVIKDDERQQAVIISTELIGLTKKQTDDIRDKIHGLTGISRENVIVCTTHTHSGPLTSDNPLMGKANKAYIQWLLGIIPRTVIQALDNQTECKAGWYQKQFTEVGGSRRATDKEVKPILTILGFVDENDKLIASLSNYNCHPTVLPAANLKISADYPGASIDLLEKVYGKNVFFAFANGACGDISTRFIRRNQEYREVIRLGSLLAAEVIKGLNKIDYKKCRSILVKERCFKLEPREIPDEDVLDKQINEYKQRLEILRREGASSGDMRVISTALQGVMLQKLLKEYSNSLEYEGSLNAIKIGEGVILSQPAELFSSLGNDIMKSSPYTPTMIIGYANGSIGYVPDRDSYVEGGYESLSCSFNLGEGERLRDTAISLLHELDCEHEGEK